MSAGAGKSPSAGDAGSGRGWYRNMPPAPCPSAQTLFPSHPEGANSAEGSCWWYQQRFPLRFRGLCSPAPGQGARRCFVPTIVAAWPHQSPLPRSALLSWLPWAAPSSLPKQLLKYQVFKASGLLDCLPLVAGNAPFVRLLGFSWMRDAADIRNPEAQALVLVSSSALRLSGPQWKIRFCLETSLGVWLGKAQKNTVQGSQTFNTNRVWPGLYNRREAEKEQEHTPFLVPQSLAGKLCFALSGHKGPSKELDALKSK